MVTFQIENRWLEVRGWNEKRIGKVQLEIGKIGLYLCCISVIMSAC